MPRSYTAGDTLSLLHSDTSAHFKG